MKQLIIIMVATILFTSGCIDNQDSLEKPTTVSPTSLPGSHDQAPENDTHIPENLPETNITVQKDTLNTSKPIRNKTLVKPGYTINAAGGTITTDSGSAATTWKARIKVKTDDGTDAWINAYSVSNE